MPSKKKPKSNTPQNNSKLTPKQSRFIEEYLIDFNACQAALRAGYSPKTIKQIGCENLSKPYLKEEIQRRMDEITSKSQVKIISVLNRLGDIIDADITDYVDDAGTYSKGSKFNGKLVNSIRQGRNGTTVTLCSKDKALELLGKYLSMWQDKIDITTTGQPVTTVSVTFNEIPPPPEEESL